MQVQYIYILDEVSIGSTATTRLFITIIRIIIERPQLPHTRVCVGSGWTREAFLGVEGGGLEVFPETHVWHVLGGQRQVADALRYGR